VKIIRLHPNFPTDRATERLVACARRGEDAKIQAVGPAAVYRALQALLLANQQLADDDIRLAGRPHYVNLDKGDAELTAIELALRTVPAAEDSRPPHSERLRTITAQANIHLAATELADLVRAGEPPVVQAAGVEATYAAIKVLAIAQDELKAAGLAIAASPHFVWTEIDGEECAAFRLTVTAWPETAQPAQPAPAPDAEPVQPAPGPRVAPAQPARPFPATAPTPEGSDKIIKISGTSLPDHVAGSIATLVRLDQASTIRIIGAAAGYVALKALIAANRYLEGDRMRVATRPRFVTLEVDGREQTAVEMPLLVGPAAADADGEEEPEAESVQVVRVSSNTLPKGAAGAIASIIRQGCRPIVQAIGADAAYISLKAIVLAQKFLAEEGIDIATVPNYHEIEVEGRERTAIRFPVTAVPAGEPASDLG
jgi:stage V sporulation protein S